MKWINKLKDYTSDIYPSVKFLYIILFILISAIGYSAFDDNLVSNDNMVVLRASFSSILGYMLEAGTSKIICENRYVKLKCRIVGGMAIWCCVIILIAHIMDLNTDNSSLIVIKNTLLSSIGFLISSAKACGKSNNQDKELKEVDIDNSSNSSMKILGTKNEFRDKKKS